MSNPVPASILARIKEAAESKGLPSTQQAIAKVAKVNQSSVSRWTDSNPPTLENALLLARAYGVCVEWIYTGRGPRSPAGADPRLQEAMDLFQLLPDATQEQVLGYLKYIRATTFTGDPDHRRRFEATRGHGAPPSHKARKHR